MSIKNIALVLLMICNIANAKDSTALDNKNKPLVDKLINLDYDYYKYPEQYYKTPLKGNNAGLAPVYFKSYYMNILMKAVQHDNVNLIKMLTKEYNITNPKFNNNDNLLILSTNYNAINIVRYLLMNNYNINYSNDLGLTALHVAVLVNNFNIAKLLLTMGADYTITDNENNTPMNYISDIKMNLLFISYIENAISRANK